MPARDRHYGEAKVGRAPARLASIDYQPWSRNCAVRGRRVLPYWFRGEGMPDCYHIVGDLAAGLGDGAGQDFVAICTEEVEYGLAARAAARAGHLGKDSEPGIG